MTMKKFTFILSLFVFTVFVSCENELVDSTQQQEFTKGVDYKVKTSTTVQSMSSYDIEAEVCSTTNLIAGQHHNAGTVSVYTDGTNLIIEYATNDDWTIGVTHLQVGDCNEGWVPLTGSGNPKVGRFDFTEPSYQDTHQVVYIISLESLGLELGDTYCFAAHAEVEGPTGGETAWAEGPEFEGRSWAMFVQTSLTDCDGGDGDGDGGGDGPK
ncbi:hypothetical protein OE09_0168 [Flavobacteriaceae bacterium MAR_2010_72]|nr:hypothetical protein OE09_0168 [Flavobacteriaceae bacterium MAR_2010_72]TVZ58131.1 hypothetical protein NA63_0624 [Flavobacteriaceae bacterium MAR_2010_105]